MKVVRCNAALDWNYLDLNGSSPGARYCFFPSEKITITLEWNINQGVEKEKDGQLWRGRACERKEPIRDDVLFLDQCWSEGAPNGGEWFHLLTLRDVVVMAAWRWLMGSPGWKSLFLFTIFGHFSLSWQELYRWPFPRGVWRDNFHFIHPPCDQNDLSEYVWSHSNPNQRVIKQH